MGQISTHSPVTASYKSVNAKFVLVAPSQVAMVEMKRCFKDGEDTAATKISQSSVGTSNVSSVVGHWEGTSDKHTLGIAMPGIQGHTIFIEDCLIKRILDVIYVLRDQFQSQLSIRK